MRPRSRQPSKRRLRLPTIKEGSEETLRDMTQNDTCHQALSSQDYLLSICHLAHPTFPAQDAPSNCGGVWRLDSTHPRVRVARPSGNAASTTYKTHSREETRVISARHEARRDLSEGQVFGTCGTSDPLEYLYGQPAGSALSTRWAGSERSEIAEGQLMRRYGDIWEGYPMARANGSNCPRSHKSSCPELYATVQAPPPTLFPKHLKANIEEARVPSEERELTGERQVSRTKPSLISQWISECKSVWRDARVKACMLPAIAEI